MRGPESAIESNWQAVRQHFKLQATPVLVLARPEVLVPLNRRFIDEELVGVTDLNATDQEFQAAVEQRMALARAGRIDEAAALDYADRGLGLLRDIAISGQTIFDVSGAEPALVIALDEDPRSEVVLGAAEVLALIDSADAQVAIAESALDDNRDPIQRVRLLRSLATSAKHFGPRLPNRLTSKLLKLVDSATGELANAAAEAHGALNLPTANAVELITEK